MWMLLKKCQFILLFVVVLSGFVICDENSKNSENFVDAGSGHHHQDTECLLEPCIRLCKKPKITTEENIIFGDFEFLHDQLLFGAPHCDDLVEVTEWKILHNETVHSALGLLNDMEYCITEAHSLLVCSTKLPATNCDSGNCFQLCRKIFKKKLTVKNVTILGNQTILADPCDKNFVIADERDWNFQKNGSAIYFQQSRVDGNYCIDQQNFSLKICRKSTISGTEFLAILLTILSALCLTMSLLVLVLLRDRKTLNGRSLICFVFCCILYFVTMLAVKFDSLHESASSCLFVGSVHYFALMGMFFWLFVMVMDKFLAFSSLPNPKLSPGLFIAYSLVGFGVPGLLVLRTVLKMRELQLHYDGTTCVFPVVIDTNYIYVPFVSVILIIVLLAILIIIKIKKFLEKDYDRVSETARYTYKSTYKNFLVVLRLLCIVSISWSIEGVSRILGNQPQFFTAPSLFNCCQGILIFLAILIK